MPSYMRNKQSRPIFQLENTNWLFIKLDDWDAKLTVCEDEK